MADNERQVDGGMAATGVLRVLGDREYQRLAARGFDLSDYGGASTRVGLCTFCGRGNSRSLLILSAVFAASGLALYPMVLRLHRQRFPAGRSDYDQGRYDMLRTVDARNGGTSC